MRSIAALPLALIALLFAVPVALAGNWAAVSVDSSSTDRWEVGTPQGLVLSLLQHGEMPVNHGTVEVALTNDATGESITGAARRVGNGLWSATIELPSDGDWTLNVSHSTLATELDVPLTIGVAPAPSPSRTPSPALLTPTLLILVAAGAFVALAGTAGLGLRGAVHEPGGSAFADQGHARLDATGGVIG